MAPRKQAIRVATSTKTPKSYFPVLPTPLPAAVPPLRIHLASYHHSLLFNSKTTCDALLSWFEDVEEARSMPWRKTWIDPRKYEGRAEEVGMVLAKRAYEVWVSEIMLQQTRVSTVIPYFNNWISTWPTVERLAEANHDEVLSAWKGLGYYSRATRLHEGAKQMMAKSSGSTCPIPNEAVKLQNFPGIGRYTAGAISSIAFGEAEPVLDGNVARVLSRQLGVYMDVKDKKTSEMLWSEADRLVKHVSTLSGTGVSAVPGQWNQALMELGSTICTPRPRCDDCPIQATCRVYSEGLGLSKSHQPPAAIPDIEDACTLCDDLDFESLATAGGVLGEENAPNTTKRRKGNAKQSNTISQYFATGTPSVRPNKHDGASVSMDNRSEANGSKKRKLSACEVASHSDSISAYCSLFPKKVAKKKVAEEECVVCIIEMRLSDGSSKWLIEQRPARGLLASLWQFPQSTLSSPANTPAYRQTMAEQYVTSLKVNNVDVKRAKFVTNYSPLLHVFTHLKLTMHVYKFRVDMDHVENFNLVCAGAPPRKWVDAASMDTETLSTGMRKCWAVSKPIPPTITSGEVEYENYDGLASTICEVTSPSDYGNSDR